MSELRLSLDDDALDRLAGAIVERIGRLDGQASPWLTAREAADYLRAPLSRIRKLTLTGDLPAHRDGGRVLYRRDELDAYIARGGARSP